MIDLVRDNFVWLLLAAGILGGMLISAATRIITTLSRERSRREIAAYVAEGSISPEQGERLIRADVSQGPLRT
jgi:hypothetical protein